MVRPSQPALARRIVVVAALGAAAVAAAGAPAAALPRLTVTTLTLRADTAHPQLEKPFHLLVGAHFKQALKAVDFLVLPNLAELEDLGDERHTLATPSGTDFTEIITVVAHHTGTIRVEPAYLDAIDARNGKPMRFSSNGLTLVVEGGALEDPLSGLRALGIAALKIIFAGAVLFVLGVMLLRRPRAQPPSPAPQAPVLAEPVAEPPLPVRLRAELARLRTARTRAQVMEVRKLLWEHADSGQGATLSDVLAKLGGREPALHPLLRLTERAAFVQDALLQGAIDDMIAGLEAYTA